MNSQRKTEAELVLETHLRELGLPDFRRELEFCAERRWRFDYAIERLVLAIEIEGGIFTAGRHTRGRGYQRDLDKYNSAVAKGWRVFRFSVEDVLNGREIDILRNALPLAGAAVGELPKMGRHEAGAVPGERQKRIPSSFLAVVRQFFPPEPSSPVAASPEVEVKP